MDQNSLAQTVELSMVPGERFADLMWMASFLLDVMPVDAGDEEEQTRAADSEARINVERRRGAADELPLEGPDKRLWFICLLSKPKPPTYKKAVHGYRKAFVGVAQHEDLQRVFRASIRAELLKAADYPLPEDPKPPSAYFDLEAAQSEARRRGIELPTPDGWY